MTKQLLNILKILLTASGVAVAAYCIHLYVLQDKILSAWVPRGSGELFLLGILALAAGWLIIGERAGMSPSSAGNGREVTGTQPPPRTSRNRWAGTAVLILLFPAQFLFSHYFRAREVKPLWFDTYWPFFMPAILGAIGLWWLYDTCLARILEGSATGKSPALRRLKLIAKRSALLILIFALVTLATQYWGWNFQSFVTHPSEKLYLTGILALLVSLVLIGDHPAFDTASSGNRYYQ